MIGQSACKKNCISQSLIGTLDGFLGISHQGLRSLPVKVLADCMSSKSFPDPDVGSKFQMGRVDGEHLKVAVDGTENHGHIDMRFGRLGAFILYCADESADELTIPSNTTILQRDRETGECPCQSKIR